MKSKINYHLPELAFFSTILPLNPIPFLNRIKLLIEDDTDKIKSNEVKACLYILNCQAYGELETINLTAEFNRLKDKLILGKK